jgi:Holliday junction resolvase
LLHINAQEPAAGYYSAPEVVRTRTDVTQKADVMPINSRQKGKRIEREAASYLRDLGWPSARRGQQYRGAAEAPDVLCDELNPLHFEVKGVAGMDVGTKLLADAMSQSVADCGDLDSGVANAVVLWRPPRKCWRLTFIGLADALLTVAGDDAVRAVLIERHNLARQNRPS